MHVHVWFVPPQINHAIVIIFISDMHVHVWFVPPQINHAIVIIFISDMHVHVWFVPPQINHAIHAYRLALPLYDGKNCVTAEVHTGLCIIICFII